MADVGINITFESVSQASASIRTQNEVLSDTLNNISTQMHNLSNTWESDAHRKIMDNFEALKTPFQNYKEIIESYAKFLDQVVQTYQDTEQTNLSNASQFSL